MNNITIVFQGRYAPGILAFSKHVRENFPATPVIVSCWAEDKAGLPAELFDYAQVIFSEDPGAIQVPKHKLDNLTRQLVSTQAGLAQVRTDYVLKLRSDITVNLKKLFELKKLCTVVADSGSRLFDRKVLVTSLTTLDPVRSGHYFHVCDWLYLGRTADVRRLFDSAALPDPAHFRYFESRDELEIASRYRPEAYIVYSLANQLKIYTDYEFSGQTPPGIDRISTEVLRNNFVVLNSWSIGLRSEKHKNLPLWLASDRYTETNCGAYIRSLPFLQGQLARLLDAGARVMTSGAIRAAKIKRVLKGGM